MLVLSRKLNQEIMIGDNIKVSILKVKGNTVRLGIDAPRHIRVVRGELPAKTEEPSANITIVFGDPADAANTNIEILPFSKNDDSSDESSPQENDHPGPSNRIQKYRSISYKSRIPNSLDNNRLKALVSELTSSNTEQSTNEV